MGGAPSLPPVVQPPPVPIAGEGEEDPAVTAAKENELTRLAARKSFRSTIRTQATQGGQLAGGDTTELFKTTLGS